MTQTMIRPEARVSVFDEFNPQDRIVHIQDPFDGFTFATTVAGIPEALATDPNLIVIDY